MRRPSDFCVGGSAVLNGEAVPEDDLRRHVFFPLELAFPHALHVLYESLHAASTSAPRRWTSSCSSSAPSSRDRTQRRPRRGDRPSARADGPVVQPRFARGLPVVPALAQPARRGGGRPDRACLLRANQLVRAFRLLFLASYLSSSAAPRQRPSPARGVTFFFSRESRPTRQAILRLLLAWARGSTRARASAQARPSLSGSSSSITTTTTTRVGRAPTSS